MIISDRRFPFIRQHDGMQCGVACLAMICRHFGMAYSLEQLSALCHPTTEGVSLKAISDAARELGLKTGDHASLIAKKGAYYNIVRNQLELGN